MHELANVCDHEYAAQLQPILLAEIKAGQNIALDASNVDEISTVFVQLVESAAQSARLAELGFAVHNPSEAFIAGYEDLGLFPNLMQIFAEPG